MSTFGDLFFNSVVLGGRGRRDAPDDASSSDGCGGDDDVELSLADDDASDGCGAGGEEPAAPDPRATFRDELLARPARPPAGGGAGFWAHFADVYDLATSLAADAGAARRAARDARADAFKAANALAVGERGGRVGLPNALEKKTTRKRMGGGGAMVKSNTQSVLVLCAHDLPLPKQRTIDDLNEMGTDLTGVYDYKLDAVAAATIDLATSSSRSSPARGCVAGRPEDRVLVVTSGGKDDWRDVLSRAERRASLEVEGRSGDLGDSAEYTARLLAKRDLSSVTVVVSPAADAASAASGALAPGVDVEIASSADRAAKKRRVS
ncbi:hypothetical protein JL721_6157 [Aureococcus anophagefferens]|nr:hypothetical protein JL721_6157 [Aureococcus anophagefferens]